MIIRLRYFAQLKDALGTGAEEKNPPAHVKTIEQLIEWLSSEARYQKAFAQTSRLCAAMNYRHVPLNTPLVPNCELALFPPVTGG